MTGERAPSWRTDTCTASRAISVASVLKLDSRLKIVVFTTERCMPKSASMENIEVKHLRASIDSALNIKLNFGRSA